MHECMSVAQTWYYWPFVFFREEYQVCVNDLIIVMLIVRPVDYNVSFVSVVFKHSNLECVIFQTKKFSYRNFVKSCDL